MKNEDIIKALGCLEMKGGLHCIPESLRKSIIAALSSVPKKPAKRSAGGRKLSDDELAQKEFSEQHPPAVKGKTPE